MRVGAVVVAYRAEPAELASLVGALTAQGARAVVVDNTDDPMWPRFVPGNGVSYLPLGQNAGIAVALNAGIRHALADGADVVVLFDQDSEVPLGFLERLLRPLTPGVPGVAAPVARNKADGSEYPARRIGRWGQSVNVFAGAVANGATVPAHVVISSGSAATAATFERVGFMDESLFIDFVDVDWCLRCRAAGVPVTVVPDAVMAHAIGQRTVRAAGGAYRGTVHSPERTYYKIRNAFLIARRRHVPVAFGVRQVVSALGHNLVQLALVDEPVRYGRSYVAAVWDGLRGRRGKRDAGSDR